MTKLNEASLAQLMRDACCGDNTAYRTLLSSIAPMLRGIVNAKAGGLSGEDREDILQDVLMAIHTKKHTWRQDQPLRPWIFAITRYKIIDVLRARGKRSFVDIDDFTDIIAAEENDTSEAMDVLTLVGQLKGKQHDVVRAIGLEGKSHSDVAAEFGMNENAVRVNFHRGLEKLRELGRDMLEMK